MDKPSVSRGFRSNREEQTPENRLVRGQYATTDFPVLSAGPTPHFGLDDRPPSPAGQRGSLELGEPMPAVDSFREP